MDKVQNGLEVAAQVVNAKNYRGMFMAQTTERRRAQDGEHEEIKQMISELKTILTARAHIDEKVEKHDKLLNGNGVPGLKTDVQLIKDQLGRLNWASGLVVAGIIADMLSRILAK